MVESMYRSLLKLELAGNLSIAIDRVPSLPFPSMHPHSSSNSYELKQGRDEERSAKLADISSACVVKFYSYSTKKTKFTTQKETGNCNRHTCYIII